MYTKLQASLASTTSATPSTTPPSRSSTGGTASPGGFIIIVLVTFVAWLMPLYRDYVFHQAVLSGWTTVAIAWQFFAFAAVVVYPLYDGWQAIHKASMGVWNAVAKRQGV
ncbi:hypothetical protein B0H63DRAFT_520800 [Podospora didyma]|uniref:Uncharacterized protein n=1 Tax=Podospora didyma TaxID=330526 RepID=A0AAE0U143_9PEZI|nr:hypothetical protein B0H63DRAFT_520800 [Podospora didyma]